MRDWNAMTPADEAGNEASQKQKSRNRCRLRLLRN